MLTGKLPFDADNAVSVAIMQMQSTPKMPREINPNIPKGLEEITLKAMQKNTGLRYKSAAEMLQALKTFEENPDITFEYRCFVDNQPTRYVEKIPKTQPQRPQPNPTNAEEGYGDDFDNMDFDNRGPEVQKHPTATENQKINRSASLFRQLQRLRNQKRTQASLLQWACP